MDKSILEQKFIADSVNPDTKINNTMFDIELELSDKLRKFGYSFSWKKFYSEDIKYCIVEFATKSREAVDWLILVLEKLQVNYAFINPSTLQFNKNFSFSISEGRFNSGAKGRLCIEA